METISRHVKPETSLPAGIDRRNAGSSMDAALSDIRQLRVLLVDDQDDVLNMMRLLLQRRSYAVGTANSAHKALQLAPQFEPHVVISDISMPGMDGYALLAELRSICREFRSIALTGFGQEDDHKRALAAGYDAHLTKPVDFDALFAKIEELGKSGYMSVE